MKRLSDIMAYCYRTTGSINGYLHHDHSNRRNEHRNIIPAMHWTQLWFLMRDVLKKEGVHAPRYASTVTREELS